MRIAGSETVGTVMSHGSYGSANYSNNIYNVMYFVANADDGNLETAGDEGDGCMDITFSNSTTGHDCQNCAFDVEYNYACG